MSHFDLSQAGVFLMCSEACDAGKSCLSEMMPEISALWCPPYTIRAGGGQAPPISAWTETSWLQYMSNTKFLKKRFYSHSLKQYVGFQTNITNPSSISSIYFILHFQPHNLHPSPQKKKKGGIPKLVFWHEKGNGQWCRQALYEFLLRCTHKQAIAMWWFQELDCQGPNPGSAPRVVQTGRWLNLCLSFLRCKADSPVS